MIETGAAGSLAAPSIQLRKELDMKIEPHTVFDIIRPDEVAEC